MSNLWLSLKFSSLLLFLFASPNAFSQGYEDSKELTVEWEAVEGSFSYEIDVYGLGDSGFVHLGLYKVKSTKWSSNLNPGKYQFRIRGIDARGVPGLWGEFIPFTVTVPPPVLFRPNNGEEFNTDQIEEASVEFEWKPVNGATAYVLEVFPEQQELPPLLRVEVPEPKTTANFPVGKKYRWQVYTIDIQKNAGDPVKTQFLFTLFGKKNCYS